MKLTATTISVSFFILLMSCCPEVEPINFPVNVEGVSPLNFNHNGIEFIAEGNVEISASAYAIVLQTTANNVKNAKPQKRGGGIFRSPDCSKCVDPRFVLEDPVVSVKITATKDFSPSYPAGADLGEIFSPIWITKDNPFSTPTSLVEYIPGRLNIQDVNSVILRYHAVVDYRGQKEVSFYGLRLLESPLQPILLQFKLELVFQSGRTISGLTVPMVLK